MYKYVNFIFEGKFVEGFIIVFSYSVSFLNSLLYVGYRFYLSYFWFFFIIFYSEDFVKFCVCEQMLIFMVDIIVDKNLILE